MGGFCRWCGKAVDADGWLEGGCSAFVAAAKFTPAGRGLRTGVALAARSGPQRLALLGNCQCGVGLRRRTALAASTPWEDLVCSGPRRIALHRSATPVRYIVERRRERQLVLLA